MQPVARPPSDDPPPSTSILPTDSEWSAIADLLRTSVGTNAFDRWFRGARLNRIADDTASLDVPGEIHQVWIEANYLAELKSAVIAVIPDIRDLRLTVDSATDAEANPSSPAGVASVLGASHKPTLTGEMLGKRLQMSGLNPNHTFASFIVGANSQFAHAACQAVANKSGITYNPLFIHGGPGLGKTHLMHAIGQEILRTRPGTRVIYLTCETFTNEFIDAVRRGDLGKFRRRYRSTDVLLIDDVQFLAGKERSQEEFFHTFNTLLDGRNQVVLSCDRPACEIKNLEPRLISRFECGLTVELQPPQMETRLAILRRKSADWKVRVDESVLTFLADRIHSNVRRLEGALMRVATYTSLAGESAGVDKVEHLLRDLLREEASKQVTIDAIQKAVAEHFDVRIADMTSRRRPASIALPRQIAMYLSRCLTRGSLVEIGEAFGGRDHGTVIHACKKVADRIRTEPTLRDSVARLEERLKR
jgi:chromosomal replication initiator protein